MGQATFDGRDILTDSYAVMKGSSSPTIKLFPRTIGGLIEESGVVEKNILLKSYLIPPNGSTRKDIEDFFHTMNEEIGPLEGTLSLNGNDYLNCNVKGITYNPHFVNNFVEYVIEFVLGNQNTGSNIRQLTLPQMVNFNRGRKATFRNQMEDLTYKTFTFWHNVDLTKNFETQLSVKHDKQFGGYSRIIKVGGFEKIVCEGWIIGPDTHNRRNLEAYFYNIMNGPLGRIGTLVIDGNQTIEKCFFSEMTMEDSAHASLKYTLNFLSSLQC